MGQLVYLNSNGINEEPFTTSDIIAEYGLVKHDTIQRLIRNHSSELEEFGKVGFEIRAMDSGQNSKIYQLNEQQATLLITFMKNTEPVVKFKKALVKEFYSMQKELIKRKATRERAKMAREALTNSIKALPDSPHKDMKYKHYTDLIYKIVFDKTSKQLREEYGIDKKASLRDRFSALEIEKIEHLEQQISVLIDLGYEYKMIKDILSKKYLMTA
jgi:phage regulator Rha-like protein